jgi:PKD repeat protein
VASSVIHVYETEGEFTYTVKVSDERNTYDIKSGMVYVGRFNFGPRNVEFKASVFETYVGGSVTFTVNASDPEGDTLTFILDFGDGTAATETKEANPNEIVSISKVHTYNSSGTYTPKVNVSDAGGTEQWHIVSKSLATPITVIAQPSLPIQPILIEIALVTVAIAAIAFIVWKRRKPEAEEE